MITPSEFTSEGRKIMYRQNGVHQEAGGDHPLVVSKAEMARFRSLFGVSPNVASHIWEMIDPRSRLPRGVKPVHLLWSLMFLKVYASESVHCALAGGVDEKTFRKWTWLFVYEINDLSPDIIKWENRLIGANGDLCLVSVDGTDFRIYERHPFWSGWFSHKFRGPGVRYEVAVCIKTGDVVWVHGPFPCGKYPDIRVFRSELISMVQPGVEKVIADKGYQGERDHVYVDNVFLTAEGKQEKALVRARHETANKRFKQFNILSRVFRHDVVKHGPVFMAVAVLAQLAIEMGEPLFSVDYDELGHYDLL